mmetsp:Transcript_83088/g.165918  ORF Transcript_83088/g.165918 Transcript_83088/m.165918 type:complete len:161 (-) Transcript_83088:744-1226(-)
MCMRYLTGSQQHSGPWTTSHQITPSHMYKCKRLLHAMRQDAQLDLFSEVTRSVHGASSHMPLLANTTVIGLPSALLVRFWNSGSRPLTSSSICNGCSARAAGRPIDIQAAMVHSSTAVAAIVPAATAPLAKTIFITTGGMTSGKMGRNIERLVTVLNTAI